MSEIKVAESWIGIIQSLSMAVLLGLGSDTVAKVILGLAKTLASTLDLDEELTRILESIRLVIPLDSCSLLLLHGRSLEIRAAFGFEPGESIVGLRMDLDRYPLNRFVIESGTPMLIDDVDQDPRWSPRASAAPIRSWMGLPLRALGEVIGMLAIDSRTPSAFTDAEREVADVFADLAAVAVRNARLFSTTRRRLDELDAVNKVGTAVASHLEVDRLCEVVGENLVDIFGVGAVYVAVWDEESGLVRMPFYSHDGQREQYSGFPFGEGLTSQVLKKRQALNIGENLAAIAQDLGGKPVPGREALSWLGVPIVSGKRALGVLCVQSYDRENAFSDDDVRLLTTIASTVGAGIRNARLYEAATAARAEAEAANHHKSRFLANMTHELRTPLNSIINLAYLIQEGEENAPPGIRDTASRIEVAGRHLLGLINDVLDMAKVEVGRMDVRLEECDFRAVARAVLAAAAGLERSPGVDIRDEIPDALPSVLADRVRLRQVLFNLLANAVKFTPSGHITLRARAGERELVAEVEDTGIGMDQADMPKAFMEFVQLDDDMDRRAGGSGLGLPLSRRLVELQGGKLWGESKKGQGSIFRFTLPRADAPERREVPA
jgi:signal transduction histidine kinase